ncbi:MAG: hypothetical protein IJG37_06515 [Synergistaceae bacterium]|nr:hypothetical protein [Synergistaceae bacterium]MBQ3653834.1 hypothetical protein [Synergistaceae bacterium]
MEIELMELAGTFAGGFVLGAAADRVAVIMNSRKLKRSEETLRRNFGEPSVVTAFTFDEAVDWITQHDDLMQNGCEAAIFKVNNQTLKAVWRLLGKLLLGALVAGAAVYVVKGIIDKNKLKEAMRDKEFRGAWIDTVDRVAKKVKLKDIGAMMENCTNKKSYALICSPEVSGRENIRTQLHGSLTKYYGRFPASDIEFFTSADDKITVYVMEKSPNPKHDSRIINAITELLGQSADVRLNYQQINPSFLSR